MVFSRLYQKRLLMTPMPRFITLGLLCSGLLFTRPVSAVESFVPPQAYPPSRYEGGWEKNPFTLKTAPVAVQKESFAKDWTLGSIGGRVSSPTVTVVNRQTHERVSLRGEKLATNGMKLKAVHQQPSAKDSNVEVELSGDVATLGYDETFLKTLRASAGTSASAGGPGMSPNAPGAAGMNPGAMPAAHPPGSMMPISSPANGAPPLPRPMVPGTAQPNSGNPASTPGVIRRRYMTGPIPH